MSSYYGKSETVDLRGEFGQKFPRTCSNPDQGNLLPKHRAMHWVSDIDGGFNKINGFQVIGFTVCDKGPHVCLKRENEHD